MATKPKEKEDNEGEKKARDAPKGKPKPPSPKSKEEVWKEGVPIPPFYFQPTLVDMLIPIKAENYKDYPYFGDMPGDIRERIIGLLPIELPLELVSDVR
jgi:hypothetical protein